MSFIIHQSEELVDLSWRQRKHLKEEGRYKHTVDLPKTAFGMRANSAVREPEIQKLWDENQVFKRVSDRNNGGNFVLHDGPPYANGDLHMGHALNKILKDIINRYKLLQNYKVHYVPGWDCHGLPIELKVMQSLDHDARKDLTPLKLRAKAAKFAKATVKIQMASFKRFGIWGDWDHPYLTLDPEYEAAQIEVFGEMALQGYIYRGRKPVHWSPSSRTALAEAELEYPEGHVSKSIYAIFRLVSRSSTSGDLLGEFLPNLSLAIWTTTPWTIPANAAVVVNPKLQYAVVEVHELLGDVSTTPGDGKKRLGNVLKEQKKPFLIIASDLLSTLEEKWGAKLVVKKTLLGSDLENYKYIHPIESRECPVVLGGDYITTESGTGLVHTAPGHGQEDYVTGLKYGLPLLSPVDDDGKFTEEAGRFSGLDVLGDGNVAVIEYLDQYTSLIMVEPYKHKYPYDWRTKKPTIFRATEQWFASVEGFKEAAMDAISKVKWVPSQAENRISAMTSSRSDWCISRQRTWGVPIPVFYHVESREPLLNEETVDHIKSIISQKGSDAWWYMSVEDLLPDVYRHKAPEYEKGTDTMDVWFDSGSSWAAVLAKRSGLSFPADLYLEGTDQHRGWFQSSLLTSIATKGKAPYSGVITHGFVLDERGLKMSKSLGNVVDPATVIGGGNKPGEAPSYGADVLRLWVSSVDYTGDVMIGSQVLRQMSDIYRKLRGTLRFLLANLHDWEADNAVPYSDLPVIDQHALFQLENVVKNINESYENYQFSKIFQTIQRFVIVDLSNFYFDAAKDRLYVGGSTSFTRRSCQTVLAAHLLSIARVIAPILPHLAEDVWQHLPFQYTTEDGSIPKFVFESRWPALNERWLAFPDEEINFWENILELRTEVNKVLEVARTEKLIGSSLEAKVYLHTLDDSLAARLNEMSAAKNDADTLHRIFITSQVQILSSLESVQTRDIPYRGEYLIQGKKKIWIGVSRAEGSKCERCWNYSLQVGSFSEHPTLCTRCYNVVGDQPIPALVAVS
ncbi:isoleucine--tRNA ligase, chloroplastic/mitochondrial isoform X2 [Rhododendron vialii]|uniref:isoleucine--tRNA ligase, chloroplastic/mitochondrial isoform X2 n=1 Tax=Rhododendron vialii TaxID=182163 RepID=UPI00265FC40C|nr:isoleucine--tRNA ligase, chloroplastic/mitochondrial isoform X2 [Rhododendron vialii]